MNDKPSSSSHSRDVKQLKRRSFPDKKKGEDGELPKLPEKKLQKYTWGGETLNIDGVKTKYAKTIYGRKAEKYAKSVERAARTELITAADSDRFVEGDDGEFTQLITQQEIASSVDITSATKYFELDLKDYGPYRINYTKSGRHLLLGGQMGHLAAFDWITKSLHHETSVMETVRDVQWLHVETMYAVAQKQWTFIYDNQGTELHCLKQLNDIRRLTFLPYHFLLVASSGTGYLHWMDVTMGKMVQSTATREGKLNVMCQNPSNAIIHCGHAKGSVSMWSPNQQEPLVRMLCHVGGVQSVTVDGTGNYMATSGRDNRVRIWDVRTFKPVTSWRMPSPGCCRVAFSQKRLLACGSATKVQIFKDVTTRSEDDRRVYLEHVCGGTVTDIQFCPYEDVLGVGHGNGFTSLLVPGSGEENFDALEANPYQSKSQRQEWEVKALLDKIQPEMINLDASLISEVDRDGLKQTMDAAAKILYVKPSDTTFKPKHKMKGRSKATKLEGRKQAVRDSKRRGEIEAEKEAKKEFFNEGAGAKKKKSGSVLDRFL